MKKKNNKNATWHCSEPTCHCLEHSSMWKLAKFVDPTSNGSPVMNFFLVHEFFLVNFGPVPDRQMYRKRLLRAHCALAQVGKKVVFKQHYGHYFLNTWAICLASVRSFLVSLSSFSLSRLLAMSLNLNRAPGPVPASSICQHKYEIKLNH